MSDGDETEVGRWKLILATFVALATTATAASVVTMYWTNAPPDADDDGHHSGPTTPPSPPDPKDPEPSGFVDPPEGEPSGVSERDPEGEGPDRQLYDLPDHGGRVVGDLDGERVGLPRLHADYDVDIRGGLATVVVEQSFENPSDEAMEAVYEFPLYSDAAVYSMTLEVGDRRIEGVVKRKEQAREDYERAKRQGKKAALLDQDRPNLFTQRVANVEPGQQVEVTLRYTHPVPKSEGAYHLTVPMAVPERYTPGDMSDNELVEGEGADDPGASAGGLEGERGKSGADSVDVSIRVDGAMPVSGVRSSTHPVRVERYSETDRWVELRPSEDAVERHFRLEYRLAGDEPRIGAHSYWDDEDERGYFDLQIEPPAEVAAESIPNREMVYVLDRSGSMNGERFRKAKEFVRRAIGHLRPSDTFRIITFSNAPQTFRVEPIRATAENVDAAREWLRSRHPGGGTEMAKAVREALAPETPADRMRLVTFVTDVKVSNEFEVVELVREHVDRARVFTMGVGPDPNTYLLDELARAGRGFSRQFQLDQSMETFVDYSVRRLQRPVFTDVSVDWGGLEPSGVTPQPVPDVFEGGTVRLHGRYGEPGTHTVEVSGRLAGEEVTYEKTVEFADSANSGEAVELAWARRRIDDYMHRLNTPDRLRTDTRSRATGLDEALDDDGIREKITTLGLDHSLTTQWTSFVAVAEDDSTAAIDDSATEPSRPSSKEKTKTAQNRVVGSGGGSSSGGGLRAFGSADSPTGSSGRGSAAKLGSSKGASAGSPSGGGVGLGGLGKGAGEAPEKETAADESEKSSEPKLAVPSPSVNGPLAEKIVRRVARQHRHAVRYCYEREYAKNPGLPEGRVTLALEIDSEGRVTDVRVVSSELDNNDVESCLNRIAVRWKFPAPDGDASVDVELPLAFRVE